MLECLLFEFTYYSKHLLHESVLFATIVHFAVNFKSRRIVKAKEFKESVGFLDLLFLGQTPYSQILVCIYL